MSDGLPSQESRCATCLLSFSAAPKQSLVPELELLSRGELMLMGRAGVRAVRGFDLVLQPKIIGLHMGQDRVLGFPGHITAPLGKEHCRSNSEAVSMRHRSLHEKRSFWPLIQSMSPPNPYFKVGP